MRLGLLLSPHANARYFHSVRDLSYTELTIMNGVLNAGELQYATMGGLELLCLTVDDALVQDALEALCCHSSCQAVFSIEGDLLRPLPLPSLFHFDSDVSAIQKYKGKTNERFTSFLINIAVFSGAYAKSFSTGLHLLDPMCGRGTTLLEGLRRGYHVSGIEIDKADGKESTRFLQQYLQYHKIKHSLQKDSMTVQGRQAAERVRFLIAEDTSYTCVYGDTRDAGAFYKKASFEAVVADLPYGIQHRSLTGKSRTQTDALMRAALPKWRELLKPGGAMALSFNAYTIKLDTMRDMMRDAGLEPLEGDAYDGMRHWVEQAVDRDVAVGIRV